MQQSRDSGEEIQNSLLPQQSGHRPTSESLRQILGLKHWHMARLHLVRADARIEGTASQQG